MEHTADIKNKKSKKWTTPSQHKWANAYITSTGIHHTLKKQKHSPHFAHSQNSSITSSKEETVKRRRVREIRNNKVTKGEQSVWETLLPRPSPTGEGRIQPWTIYVTSGIIILPQPPAAFKALNQEQRLQSFKLKLPALSAGTHHTKTHNCFTHSMTNLGCA